MSNTHPESDEWIFGVAEQVAEGTASKNDVRRLEEKLTDSPESLQRYLRFLMVDAQLRLTNDALAAISSCPRTNPRSSSEITAARNGRSASSGSPRRTSKRRWRQVAAAVGSVAAILVIGFTWQWMHPQVQIVRSVGARYISPDLVATGRDIVGRRIGLTTGLVELSFRKASATVIIEAPARFRIEDQKTLRVDYGRITAHVRDGEQGLRVLTPEMDVLDLGTRFAVDVVAGRRSEVHVFEGKVEAGAAKSSERQLLQANEALRFGAGVEPEACDLRLASFVQEDELQRLAEGLRAGQDERARRAFAKYKADPALLAAFDFDDLASEKRIDVHGARVVQGRFPGSRALDFVDVDDRAHLDWNVTTPQFTLMTWVRLNNELRDTGYSSLYHTDGWGTLGQVHWMIMNGPGFHGQMRFAIHRGWRDEKGDTSERAVAEQTVLNKLNRWIHMALTYDADLGKVTFLLNGQLDASGTIPDAPMAVLGPAEIGNWSPNANKPRRRLCGRMDDLVILSRALSEAEIQTYYQETTPYR